MMFGLLLQGWTILSKTPCGVSSPPPILYPRFATANDAKKECVRRGSPEESEIRFGGSREVLQGASEGFQIFGSVFEKMTVRVGGRGGLNRYSQSLMDRNTRAEV